MLYPRHPFAGFNTPYIHELNTPCRTSHDINSICKSRFLTFRMFHGCNFLKIKKLSVKIHCSTQHYLTPRKDINISAYLQAIQRVLVEFLSFSLSACLSLCVAYLCASCVDADPVMQIHRFQPLKYFTIQGLDLVLYFNIKYLQSACYIEYYSYLCSVRNDQHLPDERKPRPFIFADCNRGKVEKQYKDNENL